MGSAAANTHTEPTYEPAVKLEGHHEEVNCIAVSADGSLLASGSEDCSVRIWNLGEGASYECIRELVGHTEYVVCVAFVGNYLLSGSGDMTLRKWNVSTGACELIIGKHEGTVYKFVATPSLIFSTSSNCLIHAWNFNSGCLVRDFSGHTGMIYGMHLTGFNAENELDQELLPSKSGDEENTTRPTTARTPAIAANERRLRLISYSDDCTAKVWAVTKGTCMHTFIGHSGPITCIAVDSNAHCLYTGSVDGTVGQWLLETGQIIHWFKGHSGPIIALTVRGEYLYTASSDETACAWLTDIAQAVNTYKGHQHTVFQIELKDEMLITASGDGVVRVFDAAKPNLLRQFKLSQAEKINCFKIIKNLLVVAAHDGCLYGWDLNRDEGTQ